MFFSELARKVQEAAIDVNIVHNMYCVSLMFTTKSKIRRCCQESLEFTQIFSKGSFKNNMWHSIDFKNFTLSVNFPKNAIYLLSLDIHSWALEIQSWSFISCTIFIDNFCPWIVWFNIMHTFCPQIGSLIFYSHFLFSDCLMPQDSWPSKWKSQGPCLPQTWTVR